MPDIGTALANIAKEYTVLDRQLKQVQAQLQKSVSADIALHLGRIKAIQVAGGVATVDANTYYQVQPESGFADDLNTIVATHDGQTIVLFPTLNATVTVKDNTGNIALSNGDAILNSDKKNITLLYRAQIGKWVEITRSESSGNSGVENLDDLGDVAITGATNGQVLTYSSGTWINDDIPAGATPSLDDLTDVVISSPATNDVLAYDGADWVNAPINTVVSTTIPLIQTSWSSQSTATTSSTSFASKGIAVTPRYNMKLYAVAFWGTHVSGASYVAHIVTYAGGVLTGIVATSATFTVTTETLTNTKRTWLKFSSPVSLTAGTDYAVLISRTDSTDTYVLPIIFDANARIPFSIYNDDKNTFVVAEATLVGNESYTLNNNVTPNVYGWVWSYDAWDIAYAPS